MDCSLSDNDQCGYATPAALVVSLAMSIMAAALVASSVADLRLAQRDLEVTQNALLLDGAHLEAAASIVRTGAPPPYAWTFSMEGGWIEARAEPERPKLAAAEAARLDDAVFHAMDVEDVAALKERLVALGDDKGIIDVGGLDPSPHWRACAPAVIATAGEARRSSLAEPIWSIPGPEAGPNPPSWRIGETWRVVLTTSAGWRDERIVRFTGDARRPAAVVLRKMSRGEGDGGRCNQIWRAIAQG